MRDPATLPNDQLLELFKQQRVLNERHELQLQEKDGQLATKDNQLKTKEDIIKQLEEKYQDLELAYSKLWRERFEARSERYVSAGDWEEVCQRAVDDAKAGDGKARQWLADYLLGKPLPRRDDTKWMTADEVVEFAVTLVDAVAELVPDQEVCAKLAERIQDAMAGMTVPSEETSPRS